MGVYDVTNTVLAAINANLAAKIAAVGTAKSKSLDSDFTVYPRERIETFYQKTLPGVGVWVRDVRAGAKRSQRRNWKIIITVDYFFRGKDRTTVAEQVELVLDAALRLMDDLAGTATIMGAGELEFGTTMIHDIDELLQESGISSGDIISGFRLEIPIDAQDLL